MVEVVEVSVTLGFAFEAVVWNLCSCDIIPYVWCGAKLAERHERD